MADTREGYVREEFLGQILHDGEWLDYARGTESASRTWFEADPENRRVVDWIYKERVIYPRVMTHCCVLCGMEAHTDDLTIIGRNCPDSEFARPHIMITIPEED